MPIKSAHWSYTDNADGTTSHFLLGPDGVRSDVPVFSKDASGNSTGLMGAGGITHSTLGTQIITAGGGGKHATLKEALAYVSAQTGMVLVSGFTGTVTVVQNSDIVNGAGTNFTGIIPGDLIKIAGDGSAGSFISSNIYHNIVAVRDGTTLVMSEGFVGASGASKAYEIWRPNRFNIMLVDEVETADFTQHMVMPLGSNIAITGVGRTPLVCNNSLYSIRHPRCGEFLMEDLTINRTIGQLVSCDSTGEPLPALTTGFARITVNNLHVDSISYHSSNPFDLSGGFLSVNGLTSNVKGGVMNARADGMFINNIQCESGSGGSDIFVMSNPSNGAFGTKRMAFTNMFFNRKLAGTAGAGAQFELQSLLPGKIAYVRNIIINDDDQPNANPNCMFVHSIDATAKVYLENAVLSNVGLGKGLSVNNASVYTRSVHQGAGAAITSALIGTGTITPY